MLRRYLIIDGYNLMHALGFARRKYAAGQLERCRRQLLGYLSRHLEVLERERTTIVFDAGDAPPDLPRQSTVDAMSVCFASPGQEADDTIEALIAAHSAPRQIRLVSSDHRLQRSVRRRRGAFVDSDVFVAELERRGFVAEAKQNTAPTGPKSQVSASEKAAADRGMDAESWLKIFGDISEADVLRADADRSHPAIDQADVAAIQAEIDRQEAAKDRAVKERGPGKTKGKRSVRGALTVRLTDRRPPKTWPEN